MSTFYSSTTYYYQEKYCLYPKLHCKMQKNDSQLLKKKICRQGTKASPLSTYLLQSEIQTIIRTLKRIISWKQCRSEITAQHKNNNSDYLIDPRFRNINKLFSESFKAGKNDLTRNYLDNFYTALLIDNKPFSQKTRKNRRVWKTDRNLKKEWLYNRKLIKLLIPPK